MNINRCIIFALFLMLFMTNCNGQQKTTDMKNRKSYVDGKFYPADKTELSDELKKMFAAAKPKTAENVIAIISPHAGYVFSGQVAASAFNQIDTIKLYENVFIIASSHVMYFKGASVYCDGNYETPLGEVKVNTDLALKLAEDHSDILQNYPQPHLTEHSIEVQIPFLQYKFGKKLQIVPIILGTDNPADCKKLAEILKPYLNPKNLFVISSDFSHYPAYKDAQKNDSITASAILSNKSESLVTAIANNKKANISDLVTSLCGWTSVLTLMYMTENNMDFTYQKIQYLNSGDSPYGDKIRVVGYNAIAISKISSLKSKEKLFSLDENDKTSLLKLARKTIEDYIKKDKIDEVDTINISKNLKTLCGAFVTLHKNKELRGCIGSFSQDKPLYKVIQEMAIASAIRDYRFNSVSISELDSIDIEISVLTPLKKISSVDEIELGKHGIYIKKGFSSGTFLPQVADETKWSKEEFLGHCSRDKAGIGWDGWKNAELFIYEAIIFRE
ncbi:MAG: AMMECR1 domain-containing protein [Bacteroidetes bacterium CG23_combo_of_CG06-09_8_20_14_all_32_9]|nr:MAG: AMMECR1 domain-containing protein [Bacteroidetes bacterium CG23_combo_of_CG06-09_8_20_14_all_32_9]